MRYLLLISLILSLFTAYGQETVLTGVYQGHSLYIQNPYDAETDKFCIQSISVNKKEIDLNLRLSAIKLNFSKVDLFTPVIVKINHADSCKPKFINPEAILFHSSFKYDSLFISDSLIRWHTKGDKREGVYTVEKLAGGGYWNEVSTIKAKGEFEGADYVYFPLYDEGGNKYRIKYSLPNGRFLYSEEMEIFHFNDPITFSPKSVTDKITLSRPSDFQIMNSDGEVILSGSGRVIPLRRLKKGDYMIYLDGYTDSFIKK
ncbi:MAG: hypothetical protein JXQ96_12860 [Cyclobacteriaceae bacterium]